MSEHTLTLSTAQLYQLWYLSYRKESGDEYPFYPRMTDLVPESERVRFRQLFLDSDDPPTPQQVLQDPWIVERPIKVGDIVHWAGRNPDARYRVLAVVQDGEFLTVKRLSGCDYWPLSRPTSKFRRVS